MRKILLFILGYTLTSLGTFVDAADFPFRDIQTSSPYYSAVKYLFDQRIISDDGSGLFRASDTIDRDAFVGLSVSVSCRKCINPTPADILKYQSSPFVDLSRSNPYFYCIAYASENRIVQGYIPDASWLSQCQDGQKYSSNPFCEKNKTSRIEAVGMLLRQAKIWDDTKNQNYTPKEDIRDASLAPGSYWRGYAEKWLEVGILSIKNNKIFPDEYLTRWEFALMAAKMLSYNQCQTKDITSALDSEIIVVSSTGRTLDTSSFPLGYSGTLTAVTSGTGNYIYAWTLSHPASGTLLSWSGTSYPISQMWQCGTWIAIVEIREQSTGAIVSTSQATFTIICPNDAAPRLSLSIAWDPLRSVVGTRVNFSSFPRGNSGSIVYAWDFWDGYTGNQKDPNHIYTLPWAYRVTLRIRDQAGQTAVAQIVIVATGDDDSDDDGVPDDDDLCKDIFGTKKGCPDITPFDPITTNTGTTGITTTLSSTPLTNVCILDAARNDGTILAEVACIQCPCSNTLELLAKVRRCDILFPTILSPDKQTIFSRWGLYQIR